MTFFKLQQAEKAERGQLDKTARGSVWCIRKTWWRVRTLIPFFFSSCAFLFYSWLLCYTLVLRTLVWCVTSFGVCLVPMAVSLKPFIKSQDRLWPSSRFQWSQIYRKSSKRSPSCSSVTGENSRCLCKCLSVSCGVH